MGNTRLKDIFFQPVFFDDLATAIQTFFPGFDGRAFGARLLDDQWEERPLKDRMRQTALALHDFLPRDYLAALDILRQASELLVGYGFERLVFPDYVELYGLENWDESIAALELFTQQISSEFAVRPFIIKDQARMMKQMLHWAYHPCEQVRRLASEGCRPRLPWAMSLPALKADPSPILPILDALKDDPSETVRRSVANNLNDIAKDNPSVVIDTLRRWQEFSTPSIEWITGHALRSLVKAGHPEALALVGYGSAPEVAVHNLRVEPDPVPSGGEIQITFEIESQASEAQDLLIDYILHLVRANGSRSAKVFKLTRKTLAPGEKLSLRKKHSFKPISTRVYYPGQHTVEIQINGAALASADFLLAAD